MDQRHAALASSVHRGLSIDEKTVRIYDDLGLTWTTHRAPTQADLARSVRPASGVVADLGCGPGWYAPYLGDAVVSLDASITMLGQVENPLRVQGDLEHLPFRPGSLTGALGTNSYVHLVRSSIPRAFAELHRALHVGAKVGLSLFVGDDEYRRSETGDFAGRGFHGWKPDHLAHVLTGAGFHLDQITTGEDGLLPDEIQVRATRARTLPDTVGPGLKMLVCGLNPSLHAADAGVGFVTSNNRFWPAAQTAGLVGAHRDPWRALDEGVGMTDIVKRATTKANELSADEYRQGMQRLSSLVEWLQPGVLCFVGLAGYRAAVDRTATAGQQPRLGGCPVYVMPSTSGLNAASSLQELTNHLVSARELAASG